MCGRCGPSSLVFVTRNRLLVLFGESCCCSFVCATEQRGLRFHRVYILLRSIEAHLLDSYHGGLYTCVFHAIRGPNVCKRARPSNNEHAHDDFELNKLCVCVCVYIEMLDMCV